MKYVACLLLLSMFFAVMNACAPIVKSHAVTEKGADLKKYKTYTWAKPGDEKYHITYDKKEAIGFIIQLTDEELKKKGFFKTNENPDAIFIADTRLEERVAHARMMEANDGFGAGVPISTGAYYGGFSVSYYGPVQYNQTVDIEFLEGSILLEMYDRETNKLIWRGWTKKQINNNTDINKAIRKTVKKLVGKLPVKHS
ncbi:MAG: DUF4136 domain-containing protein [Cyclobacteriaceae bacterium]